MARKRRIDLEKGRFSLLAINRFFGNIPKVFFAFFDLARDQFLFLLMKRAFFCGVLQ
jgi:hypothetical protein